MKNTLLIIGCCLLPLVGVAQQEKSIETKSNKLSLLSFSGTFEERFIHLKWSPLANPQAIKMYLVEYSEDGKSFETVGKVYPELVNFYKFKSIVYHAGANYFRIIQVNGDGSSLVSHKINVMCGFADRYHLEIEEDADIYKLVLQVRNDQKITAEVLDQKGKLVQALYTGDMMKNELIFRTLDTSEWGKGTYYISIRGENFRESRKLEIK